MQLGRVIGSVVATRKDPQLEGFKLLIVEKIDVNGISKGDFVVAVDTVDAGYLEWVLFSSGSSARLATGCENRPIDAAIVAIVESHSLLDHHPAGVPE